LNEQDALQIALSESLHIYQAKKEEEEFAKAIEMSLVMEGEEKETRDTGTFLLTWLI
jgi:hypothetical protein